MTTHLTLTGPSAGNTLCGRRRNDCDDYQHAIYYRDDYVDHVCLECLSVWEEKNEYHIEATLFGFRAWVVRDGETTCSEHFPGVKHGGCDGSYAAAKAFLRAHGSPE